jgi:nucleoside-diphosphate-sugar epimerase
MSVTRLLLERGNEVYLLNRGSRNNDVFLGNGVTAAQPPGRLFELRCDVSDEAEAKSKLAGLNFDVVVDFTAMTLPHVERDLRLFHGKTRQFIFISSASAYQKPPGDYLVVESTPLANPYWQYSRDKILCEDFLMRAFREKGFPVTVVRPSHTYDERKAPVGIHGSKGSYQVLKRIMDGKQVIIHGDGSSLWTLTHAADFARGFYAVMGNVHALGQAVQITSDETLTWNQIYLCIAGALGMPLRSAHVSSAFLARAGKGRYDFAGTLIGDKSNSVVFDNRALKRLSPGFSARIRFDMGIRQAVAYIKAHPDCQVEDPEFDAWCDKVISTLDKAAQDIQ